MSPKKKPEPDVVPAEVEVEIAELAGETPSTSTPPWSSEKDTWQALRSMFSDYFKEQDLRQAQFLTSVASSST